MKGKPKGGCKFFLTLALLALAGAVSAATNPIAFNLGGTLFVLPFQKVSATQLYSFKEEKGFPAVETVLVSRGKAQLTFGAAPVLGSEASVPFVALQTRLSEKFFDTSNNALMFGVWVGQVSGDKAVGRKARNVWGIKASVPLW
jgi:hypothetical protein